VPFFLSFGKGKEEQLVSMRDYRERGGNKLIFNVLKKDTPTTHDS
jgi:hypothetical protein